MSFPEDFLYIIRPFILNDFQGMKNHMNIHIPLKYYHYIKRLKEGQVSSALVQITLQFIEQLNESKIKEVFLTASELVRNSILYDMMLPIKQQIITHFLLDEFSNNINILRDNSKEKSYRYIKLCFGNKYHPNGTWKQYHTKKSLRYKKIFDEIRNKTKKYFTLKDILKYQHQFENANKLNMLENLDERKNLNQLLTFLDYDPSQLKWL